MLNMRRGALAGALVAVCAVTGLAAGTAPAANAADAGPAVRTTYTVDANSSVRTTPFVRAHNRVYITSRKVTMDVGCYTHGTPVHQGGHNTNVWYFGSVWIGHWLDDVYVWGGNVNTPHDPPRGMSHC
ncbi:hypothetical protein ACQB60_32075 [Actinomycetota bacterium Odt1-20B]